MREIYEYVLIPIWTVCDVNGSTSTRHAENRGGTYNRKFKGTFELNFGLFRYPFLQ